MCRKKSATTQQFFKSWLLWILTIERALFQRPFCQCLFWHDLYGIFYHDLAQRISDFEKRESERLIEREKGEKEILALIMICRVLCFSISNQFLNLHFHPIFGSFSSVIVGRIKKRIVVYVDIGTHSLELCLMLILLRWVFVSLFFHPKSNDSIYVRAEMHFSIFISAPSSFFSRWLKRCCLRHNSFLFLLLQKKKTI